MHFNIVRFFNFRTLFTLLLCVTLCGFGTYFAVYTFQELPEAKDETVPTWLLGTKTFLADLMKSHPAYGVQWTILVAVLGLLVGVSIGPHIANMIIRAGKSLEQMSPSEKIAVGAGAVLAVLLMLPLYQMLAQLRIATFIQISTFVLTSVCLFYLCIVAMLSMKNELVAILSRGGQPTPNAEAADANPMAHCKILDTNVIIDGRIADVCRAGFLEGPLYVPGFVLEELQHIADSGDSLKRARGRRGLDILNTMQKELPLIVRSWDKALEKTDEHIEVESLLVRLAKALKGVIVTNDFNLNKVAVLQGVQVLNVNELANALKPVVLPGEVMRVGVVKEGKEPNQGVAYLDDGTMIVVEDGRKFLNETINVMVTSVLQTAAGKMIFSRVRTDDERDGFDYSTIRDPRDPGNLGNGTTGGSSGYTRRGTSKKIR